VAWQHVDKDVPPPSRFVAALPPSLDDLVGSATRREPSARPTDAGALLSAVQVAREGLAHGNAATQMMNPIAQDTMIVSQVQSKPGDRPSWARLPAQERTSRTTRGRASRRKPPPTLGGQLKQWHRQLTADPRGRSALAMVMGMVVLLVITGTWYLAFGRYETTPEFLAKNQDEAVQMAAAAGLKLEFDAGQFREDVPKGTVLGQAPGAGERILKGGIIVLTLSNGPERYVVPDVVGKGLELAKTDLAADPLKLVVQDAPAQYSDTVLAGIVLGTDPPKGTEVKQGSTIRVIVSKGRAPITVPAVLGKQVNDATRELEALGLKVTHELVTDTTAPRGEVIAQTPEAGAGMERNQEIKLKVSNNANLIGMPNVKDKGCRDAEGQLRAAGFQVDVNGNVIEQTFGKVDRQSPEPGKPVQQGQQVRIWCKQ
jgi:beta-lactam-binding protein with PASTA domain